MHDRLASLIADYSGDPRSRSGTAAARNRRTSNSEAALMAITSPQQQLPPPPNSEVPPASRTRASYNPDRGWTIAQPE